MALETTSAAQADTAQDGAQGEVIVVEDLWKTYTMGLDQLGKRAVRHHAAHPAQ